MVGAVGDVHVGATACLLCSRYMACATCLFKQVCLTLWDGVFVVWCHCPQPHSPGVVC